MKLNMGIFDRTVRALLSALIAILYFTDVLKGTFGLILLFFSVTLLITSIINSCPLYMPFGLNTRKTEVTEKE